MKYSPCLHSAWFITVCSAQEASSEKHLAQYEERTMTTERAEQLEICSNEFE